MPKVKFIAPKGHAIIVIASHIWGKGHDLDEALAEARKVGTVKEGEYAAVIAPEDSTVDDMGRYWQHDPHKCELCQEIIYPKEYYDRMKKEGKPL